MDDLDYSELTAAEQAHWDREIEAVEACRAAADYDGPDHLERGDRYLHAAGLCRRLGDSSSFREMADMAALAYASTELEILDLHDVRKDMALARGAA